MSNDLKQLRKQIGDLTINEQEEIFKLLRKYGFKRQFEFLDSYYFQKQ